MYEETLPGTVGWNIILGNSTGELGNDASVSNGLSSDIKKILRGNARRGSTRPRALLRHRPYLHIGMYHQSFTNMCGRYTFVFSTRLGRLSRVSTRDRSVFQEEEEEETVAQSSLGDFAASRSPIISVIGIELGY